MNPNKEIVKKTWETISRTHKEKIKTLEIENKTNLIETYDKDKLLQFYLLIEQDEIIGFISFKEHEPSYDVYNLIVDKKNQNKGYGKKLISNLFDKDIILEVNQKNKAFYFYEKLNFEKIKEIKNYYNNTESAIVLLKEYETTKKENKNIN